MTTLALGLGASLAGCTTISSRDNADAAMTMAARQERAPAPWRRDPAADAAAEKRIRELIAGDITAQVSVALCFLANPEVQLAFESLELSRSELVAAVTPPNPVGFVGTRRPGGNLSAFYPERNVTVGVLQNVLGLINLPSRRRIASIELERARLEAADRLIALAAEVNEAWLAHVAARRVHALREEAAMHSRGTLELLRQQAGTGADAELALLQERVAVTQVEGSAVRASLDVETTRARLAQAMGLAGRSETWHVSDDLPGLPVTDPDAVALERSAIEHRLDLQVARKAVESRLDAAGVQGRWRWLGAAEVGVFREGSSNGPHFTGPNLMVELPLFDQRQAQILSTSAEVAGRRAPARVGRAGRPRGDPYTRRRAGGDSAAADAVRPRSAAGLPPASGGYGPGEPRRPARRGRCDRPRRRAGRAAARLLARPRRAGPRCRRLGSDPGMADGAPDGCIAPLKPHRAGAGADLRRAGADAAKLQAHQWFTVCRDDSDPRPRRTVLPNRNSKLPAAGALIPRLEKYFRSSSGHPHGPSFSASSKAISIICSRNVEPALPDETARVVSGRRGLGH